jgi:hypothetical protein
MITPLLSPNSSCLSQEELDDTKGVLRGAMPKKDLHAKFEDTKGVIRVRTPKKDRQK